MPIDQDTIETTAAVLQILSTVSSVLRSIFGRKSGRQQPEQMETATGAEGAQR